MPELKKLTFENLAHLMERRGLLSRDQLRDVLARKKTQETRLFSHHLSGASRRARTGAEFVSPAELLASFNLEIRGSQGNLLSEDAITDALASATGPHYFKAGSGQHGVLSP